jgi:thiosulfate/3-mercaptopyruvate sulfurtransferase
MTAQTDCTQAIVTPQWVSERLLSQTPPKLLDVTSSLGDLDFGQRTYRAGHIPGAHFVHLDYALSDLRQKAHLGRHPLPQAADFAATLDSCGIQRHDAVMCYDQDSGAYAARAWWLLKAAGFSQVMVLDGGFAAWRALSLPIDQDSQGLGLPLQNLKLKLVGAPHEALTLDAMPQIDTTALQTGLANASLLLLDARAAPRFAGREEPIDPVAGHVPGAVNRPFSENLVAGRFKPAAQLRAEFLALLGDFTPANTVLMCGSGVTACHNALAMAHAGLEGAALYAPSWSGWIVDQSRPVARQD